jgi:hypothetical protein
MRVFIGRTLSVLHDAARGLRRLRCPLPRRHRCGSAHTPILASRASFSSPFSTVSPGAYFRYHQHQSCFTSS